VVERYTDMTHNKQIIDTAIDGVNDRVGTLVSDLHNGIFNEDYFIVGYYEAEEFLKSTEEGVFGAIQLVKDYEQDNFGECITDLASSEKVANMYAYIKGEELLSELATMQENWDEELTEEMAALIVAELEAL
jgi:hypothetical protein